MKKIYQKLTKNQKDRGVIFSSTLSEMTTEQPEDTTFEVFEGEVNREGRIELLLDDDFFNDGPWNYNIIRR